MERGRGFRFAAVAVTAVAGVVAVAVALAACGVLGPARSSSAGSPAAASEGLCPQADAAVQASPCVSAGVLQYQQSNQDFNTRLTVPAWRAAQARPITRRVRAALQRLTPRQRLRAAAVQRTLLAAGLLREGLDVIAGPPWTTVTFGAYEPFTTGPAVCVWGALTATSVTITSGGITREGACVPTAGGH